jgi:uncharacterized protein YqeY
MLQKDKILSAKTNKIRSTALGMILDGVKKIMKEEGREATESDFVLTAKRNIKALTATIEQVGTGDLVDNYKAQIEIYKEFLPQMADEATLRSKISDIVSQIPEDQRNMKAMGRVIGPIKKEFGDSADMAIVSKIAKELLG